MLRRMIELKRDDLTISRRKLYNEESHNWYSSSIVLLIIKSRRIGRAGHVARMGRREIRIGYWWESQKRR
jgi:reverse gyrase